MHFSGPGRNPSIVDPSGTDSVMLNSPFDDTDDVWIGHISQIRASEDRRVVKVKVRWYWSRNDIQRDCIKSLCVHLLILMHFGSESQLEPSNPRKCAPYERILSDDYDYVSPHAFQGNHNHNLSTPK